MGLGEDHGGLSPFDIYFIYTQDNETVAGFEPFDPVAIPCYEAISVSPLHISSFFSKITSYFCVYSAIKEYKWCLLLCRLFRKLSSTKTIPSIPRALARRDYGWFWICNAYGLCFLVHHISNCRALEVVP